jgi:hypothetical protein
MRQYLSLILTFGLVLLVLIGLSAAGSLEFDRQDENELEPVRSSYNPGPTGTRALYQLLEETGYPVARWRERFDGLKRKADGALLIVVGPFAGAEELEETEVKALQEWLNAGGRALFISREPGEQFGEYGISAHMQENLPAADAPSEQIVNAKSDELIAQPTELTRGLHGLALSEFAARLKFFTLPKPEAPPPPEPSNASPSPSPEEQSETTDSSEVDEEEQQIAKKRLDEMSALHFSGKLRAPVIHLGDKDGAMLADFNYGAGRVVFLSDPFVVANHGLARGANLQLTLNLINALRNAGKPIFFDEYHHGYRSEENALVRYFRGTSFWWVLGQLLLLGLLLLYSYGKRFARPLPLPQVNRHSPLEFVGSMANLQQTAQARDLAIENIYPRFKTRLCRRLGLPIKAAPTEIAEALRERPQFAAVANEVELALRESEYVLQGDRISDQRLVELVATMRRVGAELAR